MNKEKLLEEHWKRLFALPSTSFECDPSIWEIIVRKYSESHRHYHTLEHIYDMIMKRIEMEALFSDIITVDLAIFFHDIIYEPTSGTNEEDSARLFQQLFEPLRQRCPTIDIPKVVSYIENTKHHCVSDSIDNDLKLFIDIDMSILGSPRFVYPSDNCSLWTYSRYAHCVRLEYSHIDDAAYCRGRSAFLRKLLDNWTLKKIFSSPIGIANWESAAIDNINWEIGMLENEEIPSS